jgi:hypothetical protein
VLVDDVLVLLELELVEGRYALLRDLHSGEENRVSMRRLAEEGGASLSCSAGIVIERTGDSPIKWFVGADVRGSSEGGKPTRIDTAIEIRMVFW